MSRGVVYRSYAKLNLYLDVLGRRADGFHDLETIFQTVDLFDELHFSEQREGIEVTCSDPSLPTDETNLVYRAAQRLLETARDAPRGVRIHVEKHIPVGAGLAGGSGNAAATLRALDTLWGLGLTDEALHAVALTLGSDVPYCLRGGTVAATGRGEIFSTLAPLVAQWFVLVHPSLAVSTAEIFAHPKLVHSAETPVDGRTLSFDRAIAAMEAGDWSRCLFNRMEGAAFHEHPMLGVLKESLLDAGCLGAMMSGTGATVFGVCADERGACDVARVLDDAKTSVVCGVPCGVRADSDC